MSNRLYITGVLGLLASILVGIGEYTLHYDPLSRFENGGFDFMKGITDERSTSGHFFGVFGSTLYSIGMFHIYLMLKPANERVAFSAFLAGAFGCIVGSVWIGSRASVSALMQIPETPEVMQLIELYELRYETLLNVTRVTTLVVSGIFICLTLTGRSNYPRWMAAFNPFLLILMCFAIWLAMPALGKHIMPIALNVAFFIFFSLSLFHVRVVSNQRGV